MENKPETEIPTIRLRFVQRHSHHLLPSHLTQLRMGETVSLCLEASLKAFFFSHNFGGSVCEGGSNVDIYSSVQSAYGIMDLFLNNEDASVELIGRKYLISRSFIIHHWMIVFDDLESLLIKLLGVLGIACGTMFMFMFMFSFLSCPSPIIMK